MAALALGTSACLEFNAECTPPMEDPFEVVGYLGDDMDVSRASVRTRENPFGSLVADAYLDAFTDRVDAERVDLAFENAGAIREEGFCQRRTTLEKGSITRRVLREVLPFDDKILVVEVTAAELKGIFEHAVSSLGRPGREAQAGFFLHYASRLPAGSVLEVDCATDFAVEVLSGDRPPQRLTAGDRVRNLVIDGVDIVAGGAVVDPARKFRLAVNNFLTAGGDNFVDLRDKLELDRAPSLNFQVVEDYVRRKGPKESPVPAPAPGRMILAKSCAG